MPQKNRVPKDAKLGPLDQLSVRDLKLLCAIVEEGMLTRAADVLGMTQPAASYSLDKMRETLQDPLFYREKRSFHPTQLCFQVYEVARGTVAGLHALSQRPFDGKDSLTGQVNVLCRSNSDHSVQVFSERLLAQAPHAEIAFVMTQDREVDRYLMRECDFFLGSGGVRDEGIDTFELPPLPVTMIFHPDLVDPPRSAQEIPNHRYAVNWPKLGSEFRRMGLVDRELIRLGLPPRVIAYCSQNNFALGEMLHVAPLIFTGYPASLPKSYHGLCHQPLPMDVPPLQMTMSWHRSKLKEPLAAFAITLMKAVLRDEHQADPATWRTTPYIASNT